MTDEATPENTRPHASRALINLAALFLILAGLHEARAFFVPVVVAFFLSVLSYPMMQWMVKRRFPNFVALLITMLFIVCLVALIFEWGTDLLVSFSKKVPDDLEKLRVHAIDLGEWLEKKGVSGAVEFAKEKLNWKEMINAAKEADVRRTLTNTLGTVTGTAFSVVGETMIIFVLMFFILSEARGTRSRASAIEQSGGPSFNALLQSTTEIQKYLGVKTIISAVCGLLAGTWCWLFGVEQPVLWGIVAFIMHFIPAVGALLAGIPPVLLALVHQTPGDAVGVALGYLAINFSVGNFIEPALMSRRFGVSTFVIILSVVFWGWMWGGVGAFLAVPITILLKVVLENTHEFRWIGVAMSKKKVKRGEVVLESMVLDEDQMLGAGATTEPPR
jgi:predicted PurR-regulated permease PerM